MLLTGIGMARVLVKQRQAERQVNAQWESFAKACEKLARHVKRFSDTWHPWMVGDEKSNRAAADAWLGSLEPMAQNLFRLSGLAREAVEASRVEEDEPATGRRKTDIDGVYYAALSRTGESYEQIKKLTNAHSAEAVKQAVYRYRAARKRAGGQPL